MGKTEFVVSLFTLLTAFTAFAVVERVPLLDGWRFTRTGASGERDFTYERMSAWLDGRGAPSRIPGRLHTYVQPEFDDLGWRDVSVPHDWGIENAPDAMQNGIHEGNFDVTGYTGTVVGSGLTSLRLRRGGELRDGLDQRTVRRRMAQPVHELAGRPWRKRVWH